MDISTLSFSGDGLDGSQYWDSATDYANIFLNPASCGGTGYQGYTQVGPTQTISMQQISGCNYGPKTRIDPTEGQVNAEVYYINATVPDSVVLTDGVYPPNCIDVAYPSPTGACVSAAKMLQNSSGVVNLDWASWSGAGVPDDQSLVCCWVLSIAGQRYKGPTTPVSAVGVYVCIETYTGSCPSGFEFIGSPSVF